MSNDDRYEIKFVLDEGKFTEFIHWMYNSTSVRPVHRSRYVNSLYYDDVSYQSVRDNLAGISDRKKMRLRWYHDDNPSEISSLALEFKFRKGRLGHKESYALPNLQSTLLNLDLGSIYDHIVDEIGMASGVNYLIDDCYFPVLHVSYLREYYEDVNGLRITLDREINFHHVVPYFRLLEDISSPYPLSVAELKFPPEIKPNVANSLRGLHLTPKRHSKYLVGLAGFGQAVYI